MAAAIAEGIELFDIAELQASLFGDPRPQADFQSAVSKRIERAGWQRVKDRPICIWPDDEDLRLTFMHADDRRAQADFDRGHLSCRDLRCSGLMKLRPSRSLNRGSPDQFGNLAWRTPTARTPPVVRSPEPAAARALWPGAGRATK